MIEIQTDSFKEFLDTGLKEVFEDVLPISNFTDTMELEFVGYELKEPKYTLEEARIHDASYSAPIFVTFRLINKETGEILYTYAVITTSANTDFCWIHDRMPAILDEQQIYSNFI